MTGLLSADGIPSLYHAFYPTLFVPRISVITYMKYFHGLLYARSIRLSTDFAELLQFRHTDGFPCPEASQRSLLDYFTEKSSPASRTRRFFDNHRETFFPPSKIDFASGQIRSFSCDFGQFHMKLSLIVQSHASSVQSCRAAANRFQFRIICLRRRNCFRIFDSTSVPP